MRRAVYLDFSTPLFEKDSNLKGFSANFKDLLKSISKTRNTKYYISITLDFLTTFKNDFDSLVAVIKELQKEDRVEFVVRDSFDVDSLSLPRNTSEFNYIFNEYLLGYYFGDRRNFEGDPSIMIKNLNSIMPLKGQLKEGSLEFLKGMGYSSFLLDKSVLGNQSFIHDKSLYIEVDYNFSDLFSGYVEKETLDNYLMSNISHNFIVYYVNPYQIYLSNPDSFVINFSNLFHLIDLNDKVEFRFATEYFDMPVHKDLELNFSPSKESELHKYQSSLAKFMKLELPEAFDMTIFEDLRTSSLWEGTGNKIIDEYLRTSFLMLTLLSNSINDKINLLNKHLVAHLSAILDELDVYSSNNADFKKSIQDYRSFINQK